MASDYYLNGSHPKQSEGKRIAAGYRILAADGAGNIEGLDPEPGESEFAGFSVVDVTRARVLLQDALAA